MSKIIQHSSLLAAAICVLMMVQFIGCGEDEDEETEAPPLPPDGSMTVDLSSFEEGNGVLQAPAVPQATYKNFGNAVARVVIINSSIAAALVSPATLFTAARLHEPVEQDDGSWVWGFSVKIDYVTFTASLTGRVEGETTYWSMKVSTDAPLHPVTDFEWYTGESGKLNTTGSWQFHDMKTPDEQNPTVRIDWSVQILMGEAHLTIENVDPRGEYQGDTLTYSAGSLSFNDASDGETWEILWDIETGKGSITVPGYNDGEKACWNILKQDVECD